MQSKTFIMLRLLLFISVVVLLNSCKTQNKEYHKITSDASIYHESLKALTDVIVHDIFSPPVASRIYTYSNVAGYEGARYIDSSYTSLGDKILHMPALPKPEKGKEYSFEMVGTIAMLKVGKNLIFSEDSIQKQIDKVYSFYQNSGMPDDIFERSSILADTLASSIILWSSTDNYKQTRSSPKYTIQNDPATWKPTPPGYMDGIEPSWNKIRPFVMDSAAQFKPAPPTPYNMKDKNSLFYKEAMEVYNSVKNGSEEQKEIANFWDCNPFKLNVTGHVMHATKKISPGGHWINITGIACKKAKFNVAQTTRAYAFVSIGLADAFISCWDEKYRSNVIRPETVINEFIDPDWAPLLQTPPFPEYTSGHSVASGSASVVTTYLFGDNFSFTDDSEVEFGLKERSFRSFFHAVDEASISRLYGGIHYMPAIRNGVIQGKAVGSLIVEKLSK